MHCLELYICRIHPAATVSERLSLGYKLVAGPSKPIKNLYILDFRRTKQTHESEVVGN